MKLIRSTLLFRALLLVSSVNFSSSADAKQANEKRQTEKIEATGRTFFYDDHQIFFTLMIYFPFIVDVWSYGIPLTSVNQLWSSGTGSGLFREGSSSNATVPEGVPIVPKIRASTYSPYTTTGASEDVFTTVAGNVYDDYGDNNSLPNVLEPLAAFRAIAGEDDEYAEYDELNITTPEPPSVSDSETFPPTTTEALVSRPKRSTTLRRSKRTLYIQDQEVDVFLCLSMPFSVPILRYDEDLVSAYWNKKRRKEFEDNLPNAPLHDDELVSNRDEADDERERLDAEAENDSLRKRRSPGSLNSDEAAKRTKTRSGAITPWPLNGGTLNFPASSSGQTFKRRRNDRFGGLNLEDFGYSDKHKQNGFNLNSNDNKPYATSSCVSKSRRRPYFETMFDTLKSPLDLTNHRCSRRQLWTPLDDKVQTGMFTGRSSSGGLTALASNSFITSVEAGTPLVGVTDRVIDSVLDAFPSKCRQRVLCRTAFALAQASPVQAVMLYIFGGKLFGLRDAASQDAITSGMEGLDCMALYEECGINGF